jgi:antitoxin component of MazEF toxin-antitoxin module
MALIKAVNIVEDAFGTYEIPPNNIMATAPKRRDGWFDMRTIAGRVAARTLAENQRWRAREFEDGLI